MGEAIQNDPRHIAWKAAKRPKRPTPPFRRKFPASGSVRDELMEANMAGSHDDAKIAALSDEMRAIYEEIMANEFMAAFSEAQESLNELMARSTVLSSFM